MLPSPDLQSARSCSLDQRVKVLEYISVREVCALMVKPNGWLKGVQIQAVYESAAAVIASQP